MRTQDFENELVNRDIKKAVLDDDILIKILIKSNDIVSNHQIKFYKKAERDQNHHLLIY